MGGGFAALNNFTKSLVEMMYFRRRNWMNTKKKRSLPQIGISFPRNQVKTKKKKKVFAAICDDFRQEICRIF